MKARLRVVARAAEAELHGDGERGGDGPLVVIGDAEVPEGVAAARVVRWVDGRVRPDAEADRVIGQAGDGGWRLAPWPAADGLFELPLPPTGAALVVTPDATSRERVMAALEARGVPATPADRLHLAGLRAASTVVFPTLAGDAFPAQGMAALAARRLVVSGPCAPCFGLIPEVDWFPAETEDDMAQYADAAASYPAAFDLPRVLGAVAAERHRASAVYARLATDLSLEGVG